jgi:hypothetical protein
VDGEAMEELLAYVIAFATVLAVIRLPDPS